MSKKLDLADYHEILTDRFENLRPEEAWEKYALSEEQIEFFNENGFLSGVKILDEEQIQWFLDELTDITSGDHEGHDLYYEFHHNESFDPDAVLLHALGHWRISRAFHDVLWSPRFVVAASQLLGNKPVRFWHDQLFCKPAHHGGVVAWHQDYSYWTRTVPMQHLTCWIGLDDATEENGCLRYVPGSHRWSLLQKPELAGEFEGLMDFISEDQKTAFNKQISAELPRGYASFHHPLTVHGSTDNRSPRSRRAFVINVFADGTRSDTDESLLAGVPPVSKGNTLRGKFFPLLFTPPQRR